MTPLGDAEERSEIEDAKAFLENLLADGPVSSKPIRADAEGAGYSWATIRRAQKALGIVPAKEGMKGPWLWKLPPKVLNDAEDAHSKKLSTFDENEHLRQADSGWEDV
jgi:putative DNA primase/helicase